MAASDGSLIFDTRVDTSGLRDGVEHGISETGNQMENFVTHTLANLASQMISKITSTAAEAVSEGIELASNMSEVKNVVDTTFGSSADTIYAWSDKAAESFGISSLAAQQYTGSLGAMLKSSGVAANAVTEMSTALVGLSGDMASFYNLDIDTAFEKIRSGISGETEPLKQLGINMSVANLEAFALAQGIKTAYSEMSQAEQVMLRYQYLLSVTSDAQGDFAKTSDSFANQQRIMELNFQNMKQTLGEALMPAAQEIVTYVNEHAPEINETIKQIGQTLTKAADFLIEHKDALISFGKAASAAVIAYKGLSVVQSTASAIQGFSTALSGAATAQQALNIAMGACPWVAIGTLAVGGAMLLKDMADEYIAAIGYEGEIKEAYNLTNEELAIRKNTLVELSKIKPFEAYTQAASELESTAAAIESNTKKIEGLKIALEHTSAVDAYDLYTKLEQEIAGLEEQNIILGSLYSSQKAIVEDYEQNRFKLSVGGDLEMQISRQKAAAEDYAKKQKEMTQNGKTAAQTIADIMTARSAAESAAIEANTALIAEKWSELDHKYAMGIISSESDLYNERLALMNKYGNESCSDQWRYYEELADYRKACNEAELADIKAQQEDIISETETGLNKIDSIYQKKYSELLERQNKYRSVLMNIGGDVFEVNESTEDDGSTKVTYSVNNIDEQIAKMKAYHEDIRKLKEDGASSLMLSDISALSGDDAARMAEYIANMGEGERQKIIALYDQKQAVADALSADLYADEAASMQEAFAAAITDIGVDSYASGQAAAEQFASGFNGKLSELIHISYASVQPSLTPDFSYYDSSAALNNDKQKVDVTVEVTGGELTFNGEKYGEYVLDYTQRTNISQGR